MQSYLEYRNEEIQASLTPICKILFVKKSIFLKWLKMGLPFHRNKSGVRYYKLSEVMQWIHKNIEYNQELETLILKAKLEAHHAELNFRRLQVVNSRLLTGEALGEVIKDT